MCRVSATATVGTHTLSVTTFYGDAKTPPGLSLQVLDQDQAQITVKTIADTGYGRPASTTARRSNSHSLSRRAWQPWTRDGSSSRTPLSSGSVSSVRRTAPNGNWSTSS